MRRHVVPIARGLVSLFAPTVCPACLSRVERSGRLCSACAASLRRARSAARPRWSSPADPIAAFSMRGVARGLIHRMKYQGDRAAARILSEGMAAALREGGALPGAPVLVPVPLHPTRFRERGFNQAERLAQSTATLLGGRVRSDLLRRLRWEGSQTARLRPGRRRAVAGAFVSVARPPGGPIVLVDDVWTTGATARECRRVLLGAGAVPPVRILVAARTPRLLSPEPDS